MTKGKEVATLGRAFMHSTYAACTAGSSQEEFEKLPKIRIFVKTLVPACNGCGTLRIIGVHPVVYVCAECCLLVCLTQNLGCRIGLGSWGGGDKR